MIDFADKFQKNWKKTTDLWIETSNNWKDDQQGVFDNNYIKPLTNEARSLIQASAQLVEVLVSARRHVK